MKDSGRQKDRQRWERKEWASLVEKHPRRVKASPWGHEQYRVAKRGHCATTGNAGTRTTKNWAGMLKGTGGGLLPALEGQILEQNRIEKKRKEDFEGTPSLI